MLWKVKCFLVSVDVGSVHSEQIFQRSLSLRASSRASVNFFLDWFTKIALQVTAILIVSCSSFSSAAIIAKSQNFPNPSMTNYSGPCNAEVQNNRSHHLLHKFFVHTMMRTLPLQLFSPGPSKSWKIFHASLEHID